MLEMLLMYYEIVRGRLAQEYDENGYTTEGVILTAILAGLALAVGSIIVTKVTGKANQIPVE